ncbi:helix-turn-helix domain-containing protein [Clostridium luticellarii]|uniref:Transposase IS30-like HTH domain-containing protein n=1 Tax=Clostridium luticellarii TaxID=1691940 RepID=A0A2T0BLK6_9CLOT|nr:helix-turn-helix domain-containing protein [Clostridium luticellarii]PRR84662.1 hypothetical protein CLLU_23460 [Clostridium luticellarii]
MTDNNKKQINLNDRMTIEMGLVFKDSIIKIAVKIIVHPSTVTREIKNNFFTCSTSPLRTKSDKASFST